MILLGESILSFLCARRYLAVAEEMIRRGANVSLPGTRGTSPIFWATSCGNERLLKLLFANGADIIARRTDGSGIPLMKAVLKRNDSLVRILLDAGADLREKSVAGKTPLILAVETQDLRVIETLLRAGADVEAKGSQGQTPDSVAKSGGDERVIELLCRARDGRI